MLLFEKCFAPFLDNDQPAHPYRPDFVETDIPPREPPPYREPQPPDGPEDVGQPYLLVDLYPYDQDDPRTPELDDPKWEEMFAANPNVIGGVVKLHDGGGYAPVYTEWGVKQLGKILSLKKFGGGYVFTNVATDAINSNAEPFGRALERAGWVGDPNGIVACIDLEESAANNAASPQQLIDHTSKVAEWLVARFAREVMLYGRGIMRDKCISSRMGCSRLWNPSYTRTIHLEGAMGLLSNGNVAAWDWETMGLWQAIGDGDGDSTLSHIPRQLTVFGKVDISAVIDGPRAPTMERARRVLL